MSSTNIHPPVRETLTISKKDSILKQLHLTDEERTSLKRQGFVQQETRSEKSRIYKLRFRFEGRQRVLYLGIDPARATAVEEELRELQREEHINRELRRLTKQATLLLQNCKVRLAETVEEAGFRFHGRDVRRPRALANPELTKNPQSPLE